MPDPTAFVLKIAFLAALEIFVAAAIVRHFLKRRRAALIPALETRTAGEDSIEFPRQVFPPPLPIGVLTWPYRPVDFVWAGFIFLVFFFLSIGNATMEPDQVKFDTSALLVSIGFQATLAVLTSLFVLWRIDFIRWLGLRWPNWPWVFLIAPAAVLAMYLVFGALQAAGYMKWMDSLGVESVQESVKLLQTATDPTVLTLMAVAAVLVAPICEEIVFRGYLYPVMKKFAGPWIAAVCSGLLFAAAHGSLYALLPLTIFGILLAVLYEKTGSLWAPMAVHFCFNGATVGLQTIIRHFPHLIEQAAK